MKYGTLILILILTIFSCKSSKTNRVVTTKSKSTKIKRQTKPSKTVTQTSTTKPTETVATNSTPKSTSPIAKAIIKNAEHYKGTRYKYGGTTKKGIDCSGLVYNAFKEENITIPRTSSSMSKSGDWIDLKTVQEGDLLFFATRKNSRDINHVGLVTAIKGDDVEFIHSTTSKGVITSKLKEKYWYFAFVQARRVL